MTDILSTEEEAEYREECEAGAIEIYCPVLNPIPRGNRAHSTKDPELYSLLDNIRRLVSMGESVSELQAYDMSSSRFRRGNCLKALRNLNRMYPKQTQMILTEGIWWITSVIAKEQEGV